MNSKMAATFMAIPPKKYHEAETPVIEVKFAPLKSRKQNMVAVKGMRKPSVPSSVGLPRSRSDYAVLPKRKKGGGG